MEVRHFNPFFSLAALRQKRGPLWLLGVLILSLALSFFQRKKVGDPATDQKKSNVRYFFWLFPLAQPGVLYRFKIEYGLPAANDQPTQIVG